MIPGLPSMGGAELLIILLIILLFFGANRLPKVGRSLGSGIREFRQGLAQGGNDKEEVQDRKIEQQDNEREPSLNGAAAHNKAPRKEETSHQTEQTKA